MRVIGLTTLTAVNLVWLPITLAFEVTPGLTAGDVLQVATVVVSIFTAFQAIKGRLGTLEGEIRSLGGRVESLEARARRRREREQDEEDTRG